MLNAPQIVGLQVSPLGTYPKTVSSVGGTNPTLRLGSLFWRVFLRKQRSAEAAEAASSDAPDIDSRGYLAVTNQELVFVDIHVGARVRLGAPLAEVPRSDIGSAELRRPHRPLASLPPVITFHDGRRWIFEAGWFTRGRARTLVETLNGDQANQPPARARSRRRDRGRHSDSRRRRGAGQRRRGLDRSGPLAPEDA